jgi:hypothetical protein
MPAMTILEILLWLGLVALAATCFVPQRWWDWMTDLHPAEKDTEDQRKRRMPWES